MENTAILREWFGRVDTEKTGSATAPQLKGRLPWDGPGRPVSTNMNLFSQLMSYGPRIVPVAPLQSVSNRPAAVYQCYVDEMPRYRSGTGTYLPNPHIVPAVLVDVGVLRIFVVTAG
ncbi:hypothetical protein CJ030_MR7G027901 [Morella rubra]|uniref:Uncharacterized protein n=1 Tax=Morella rubra TaxID=262757 RepID=A0A6A1UZQ9_9ROSI|nr:hypothetical protein CJ030_MR7G027901 [Morella rubra]